MKEICPVCGCRELECLNKAAHTYRCKACGEKFDLTEKPPVEKIIEKVIVEKPVEKDGLTPAEIYKKNIDGIFELKCGLGEIISQGTGFYISADGYAITNSHVVIVRNNNGKFALCDNVYAYSDRAEEETKMQVVYIDPKNDLALLKADSVSVIPLRFTDALPEIGSSVIAIGNSKGQGLSVVNGIVGDLNREFMGHSAFLFNALVAHGCSGGPVFDKNGKICGVTVGETEEAEGMKYAIPLDTVIKFLKIAEIEKGIKIELL